MCVRARMRYCALEISVKKMLTYTKVARVMFEELVIWRRMVHINAQVAPTRFYFDYFFHFHTRCKISPFKDMLGKYN